MKIPPKHESWKMFDQISSTYDKINRVLSLNMDLLWRKKLSRFLPPKKDLKLLDLATGTGDQLFSFFENAQNIESAVGLDLSKNMLEIAKQKGKTKTYQDRISWVHGDAENLPFPDQSFDVVSFSFGIRNVPSFEKALFEIERVLKPHGLCLILEFSLPKNPIRPFYLFYLRHILPKIGNLLSKSKVAYRYLDETIESFPERDAFLNHLKKAAFQKTSLHSMALGAVHLYVGEK